VAGYHVDVELVDNLEYMGKTQKKHVQSDGRFMIMRSARTNQGNYYLGSSRDAYCLFVTLGLTEVQPGPDCNVCTIGFSKSEGLWYGWSHRAIVGFGRGHRLFDPEWKPIDGSDVEEIDYRQRGENVITSFTEAKQAAIAFAEYVS